MVIMLRSLQALELLQKISVKVDVEDKELLMKIAMTSMYSKIVSEDSHLLSQIAVNATKQVAEKMKLMVESKSRP